MSRITVLNWILSAFFLFIGLAIAGMFLSWWVVALVTGSLAMISLAAIYLVGDGLVD
ncbi:MAG: hypothetical protein ACUZ8A_06345 [Candidatus Bathyanammoxibius sp.]